MPFRVPCSGKWSGSLGMMRRLILPGIKKDAGEDLERRVRFRLFGSPFCRQPATHSSILKGRWLEGFAFATVDLWGPIKGRRLGKGCPPKRQPQRSTVREVCIGNRRPLWMRLSRQGSTVAIGKGRPLGFFPGGLMIAQMRESLVRKLNSNLGSESTLRSYIRI